MKQIEAHLAACNIPLAAEGVLAKWQPTAADLQNCEALGRKVAAAVKRDDNLSRILFQNGNQVISFELNILKYSCSEGRGRWFRRNGLERQCICRLRGEGNDGCP